MSPTSTGVSLASTTLSTTTLPSTTSTQTHQQNRRKNITLPFSATSSRIFFSFLEISATLSLYLSFALKNLSFSLQLSQPLVEEPKREREKKMASFSESPPGDPKVGEKIFKTKCAQCNTVDKGAGHRQGIHFFSDFLFIFIDFYMYSIWLRRVWI